MKVSNEIPAIYAKCKEKFGVDWDKGIIMTYGDTVYSKWKLSPDKKAHELVHTIQQTNMDKDEWWDKYFNDEEFRLSQEVEAYREEAKFVRKYVSDRNQKSFLLNKICIDLSSSIYGNICTMEEAKELIK